MGMLDLSLQFSNAQAITATAQSTNFYDQLTGQTLTTTYTPSPAAIFSVNETYFGEDLGIGDTEQQADRRKQLACFRSEIGEGVGDTGRQRRSLVFALIIARRWDRATQSVQQHLWLAGVQEWQNHPHTHRMPVEPFQQVPEHSP